MKDTVYTISINGLNLHHIISFFEREGFNVQNLARKGNKSIVVSLYKSDYKKLIEQDFSQNYKISIIKKVGKEEIAFKIFRHFGLILGVVLSIFIVIASTSRISYIEINSENHVCKNHEQCIFTKENQLALRNCLKKYGIETGEKLPNNLSYREIERNLMQEFKQISGVTLTQYGTKIRLEIQEANIPEKETASNLVAPVSGVVITNNIVSGKSSIKNGDIVLKGQTLVTPENGNPVSATFEIRTFYHENMVYSENITTYKKTGKTQTINSVSLFGQSIGKESKCKFALFESKTTKRYAFYNLFLPFISKSTTYYELKREEIVVPFEAAKEKLKQDLTLKTMALIPENATQRNITFATFKENDKTRLDCYIECILKVEI